MSGQEALGLSVDQEEKLISRNGVKEMGGSNKGSIEKNNEAEVNSLGKVKDRNLEKGLKLIETKDNATQMQGDRRPYRGSISKKISKERCKHTQVFCWQCRNCTVRKIGLGRSRVHMGQRQESLAFR